MTHATRRSRLFRSVFPACLATLLATLSANADVLVNDHFDDGILDPAWQVDFQDAHAWTYEESGTNLTVTDIDPEVVNPSGGGPWAVVSLSRAFSATDDFHVDFDFSWDCEGNDTAMQRLTISLLDGSGGTVAAAGLLDSWISARPCQWVLIGASSHCEADELPHSGVASVDIDRADDQVAILWNGTPILSDVLSTPIESVKIIFSFYACSQPMYSTFGPESLDQVSIEGTPTPVEAGSWGSVKGCYR